MRFTSSMSMLVSENIVEYAAFLVAVKLVGVLRTCFDELPIDCHRYAGCR